MPKQTRDPDLHKHHRQRMRQQFLERGLDQFTPHQVLEMLLFYSIPRQDTNETAHRLIKQFGSVGQVLDAEYKDLCKVEGVGPQTATLITFCGQLLSRSYKEKNEGKKVTGKDEIKEFLINEFINVKNERVYLLSLNNRLELLNATLINEGTVNSADADLRKMAEASLQNRATAVVLAHNHPEGFNKPSEADVQSTMSIVRMFKGLGIEVYDHYIYGNGQLYSMRSDPYRASVFSDVIHRWAK